MHVRAPVVEHRTTGSLARLGIERGSPVVHLALASDHTLVRQGLLRIFQMETDMTVVGEAADGLEAVCVALQTRPDVLVVDMAMPNLSGPDAVAKVRRELPETKVVIVSMHADEEYLVQALRSGADGYVLKDDSARALVQAVRDVVAGRRYLSPRISERAIQVYIDAADCARTSEADVLTDREREVLRLAAEGLSNRTIASMLFISTRTVETHRANMMRKLGIHGQSDLVRYAVRTGLILID